ncbi:MAG TPA: DUF2252 domain-containing protein [Gaiellaceae bacterium]|nr:DUF2252 domain-containing protein [Gaiellaceae bacterium]
MRKRVPRTSHATLEVDSSRDPIAVFEAQDRSRLPSLVPIRYGRMLTSPFAFYRGGAALMAHDLARTPSSGLDVQLCGDAHLANFGGFGSPERDLVLDLNDFDETLRGPFEWDVKRLATSFEIVARDRAFSKADRTAAVLLSVRSYREAMRQFAAAGDLDVWYAHLDVTTIVAELQRAKKRRLAKKVKHTAAKVETDGDRHALSKLTRWVTGKPRLVSNPPLITPLAELTEDREAAESGVLDVLRTYRRTLSADRRALLDGFRYADLARKVVGVSSVGTSCWVVLMVGRDERDLLFLQVKEAEPSVLEPVLGASRFANHGRRVVEGQRLIQAASDILLGWARAKGAEGAGEVDFYVRQLRDWKTSVDVEGILPSGLAAYAQACGWVLARAHARSGDRIAIEGYLGKNDVFDRAIAEFAAGYADLNERDREALRQVVTEGRLQAQEGV